MRIAIAGSSGLLGSALTERLRARGHTVVRLVRGEADGEDERPWRPESHWIAPPALADVDAAVCLAGASIATRPWTRRRKRALVESRLATTATLAEHVARGGPRCRTLLAASAMGYYGAHRGEEPLPETAGPGDDFLANLTLRWEARTAPAARAGARVVRLRTANVLTNAGGFIAVQRPAYLAGLGGPVGDGRGWLSWITLEDHVRAMVFLLGAPSAGFAAAPSGAGGPGHEDAAAGARISGPVNLAAPGPVRQGEFARAYARSLRRPALVSFPRFAAGAVLGGEMVDLTIGSSQRLVPERLRRAGFSFHHPTLPAALEWLAQGN